MVSDLIDLCAPHRLQHLVFDTPVLLIDLDTMEANIAWIAEMCRAAGVAWRPHTKGLKTPEIALRAIAAGAVGVTCAKLGEAEIMAASGITDILIANQIVGETKLARLMALTRLCKPIVAIDHIDNLEALSQAARAADTVLRVVIEVDIGLGRAGVEPGATVLALAKQAASHSNIHFEGVMGWEARALLIVDPAEKAEAVAASVRGLTESAALCRAAGLPVTIVSCGGTGTFPACARQPGVTEVQAGGGIVSDMHYQAHYNFDRPQALTILTTVTSRPTATRIILDAGRKAMSGDVALPRALRIGDVASMALSAEHTTIELKQPSETPRVGDYMELVVGYSDSTVHLHENVYGMRGHAIEAIWPVAARGKIT